MIRSALFLPALLALSACASAGTGADAADVRTLAVGGTATLAAGESVALPDASRLTYVGVRSDSRCPPDVQCIQAGNAVVAFRRDAGDSASEFQLVTGKQESADVGAWRLTLAALDRATPPNATVRLDAR
jgi:hypothetical protein